jgi:hypothetical protein
MKKVTKFCLALLCNVFFIVCLLAGAYLLTKDIAIVTFVAGIIVMLYMSPPLTRHLKKMKSMYDEIVAERDCKRQQKREYENSIFAATWGYRSAESQETAVS